MGNRRNASLAAAVVAGVATGAAGLGYGAARLTIAGDRRRHGVTGSLPELARAELADPQGTRTETIPSADGGRLFVRHIGPVTAPPIVLLHGVTLDGSIWHSQLRDLQNDFHVVAPDWRGHGRSTPGRNGFGLGELAADLNTLLEAFDLRGAVLVGHSMGGMAIMRWCSAYPGPLAERVAGLVFQSTAAFDVGAGPLQLPIRLGSSLARKFPGAAGRVAQQPADLGYVGARLGFGNHPSPVWVEQARLLLERMDPESLTGSVLPLLHHDERAGLPSVEVPSLVLVGTHDRVTPLGQAEAIAGLLPNARLQSFGGAGHTLMLERSVELSDTLRHFAHDVRSV